jgi:hypothetical protein
MLWADLDCKHSDFIAFLSFLDYNQVNFSMIFS